MRCNSTHKYTFHIRCKSTNISAVTPAGHHDSRCVIYDAFKICDSQREPSGAPDTYLITPMQADKAEHHW